MGAEGDRSTFGDSRVLDGRAEIVGEIDEREHRRELHLDGPQDRLHCAYLVDDAFCPIATPNPGSTETQELREKPTDRNRSMNPRGVWNPTHPGSATLASGFANALNHAGPGSTTKYRPPGRRHRRMDEAAAGGSG
jgi:hypothetical protein